EIRRQVVEVRVVLLRDDDHVAAPDRVDVEEPEDAVRLVDDVRGQRLRADTAEEAVRVVPLRVRGGFLRHVAVLLVTIPAVGSERRAVAPISAAARRRGTAPGPPSGD